jgi:RNA polymerase sigma-70 factor (ECF subfamily)
MTSGAPSDKAQRFLELLEPIEAELEGYARRLIWDPQELPDAVHNAIARAIAAFDRYHEGTNFRAWMFTILTREVFAMNRKHHRLAVREFQMEPDDLALLAEVPSPREPEGAHSDSWGEGMDEDLVLALRTLTDPERASLLLRALEGFKYSEISQTLEMPVGSVMGYLGRARKKMRHALARTPFSNQAKGNEL